MQRLVSNFILWIAMALVWSLGAAAGAETTWPPDTTPAQINITTESAPGWLPSEAQIADVRKTTDDFLAAKDSGRSAEAYALLADANREQLPFPNYADALAKFNLRSGAVIERRIIKITWTKDPAGGSAPGVYAALDMVSLFANIDRHCGFLILYQPSNGGAFRVMREEENFIDNAMARTIEQEHSRADVESVWSQLSAHCPNYPASRSPLPEQPASSIGYPSVDSALADLRSRPGVAVSSKDGWTIASDAAHQAIWSFPPPGNPAYPAAVKRQIVQQAGQVSIVMTVLCQASKTACDDLVRSFEQLDAQMKAAMIAK